jgi:Superfamily I DNA and RNA helicases and helicase subunits
MSLHVYKIGEYDHKAEEKQFNKICEFLRDKCNESNDDYFIIGNYNIEGVELDALLITQYSITVLEFKNWGGRVLARENSDWTANGTIIAGGFGGKTPFEQIRLNRSRVSKNLSSINPKFIPIKAVIIFGKTIKLDDELSETVHQWFSICDNHNLNTLFQSNVKVYSNKELSLLVEKLNVGEFDIDKKEDITTASLLNDIYEPEPAIQLIEELKSALNESEYRQMYSVFNDIFIRFLDQNTNFTRMKLVGPFAKTDYLLKEFEIDPATCKAVNDARVRFRTIDTLQDSVLKENYLYDFKALCLFISTVCSIQIPNDIINLFPASWPKPKNIASLIGKYMRIVVHDWDEDYIYGQEQESRQDFKICYSHGNNFYPYDWSYIKDILYKFAQINIIRPRQENDIIFPELIIFEPDYLVNITAISSSFKDYAHTLYVHLLNKIKPFVTTQPILLGNFASQLLDEAVHESNLTYNKSIKAFFKQNALTILSVNSDQSFHSDAQHQQNNINNAVTIELKNRITNYDKSKVVLEPSFFSEMLGLQGRMDFLQMDFTVLIEQKSGKCAWPQPNPDTPKQTEEHYVQMLLYMALLKYNYRNEQQQGKLNAFLLYSKYNNSLLGLGNAPELLFEALKVRNKIVWSEYLYSRGGIKILDEITADKINVNNTANNLWKKYQKPQIEQLLKPLQIASPLEKSYYFRFLTFISNEHLLSKVGKKGFASNWNNSLKEKRQSGDIYDDLSLIYPLSTQEGSIEKVRLAFKANENNVIANFRKGDIVALYYYDKDSEPDIRKSIVIRGTIKEIASDNIQILLRNAQSDARIFYDKQDIKWAIEHDFYESSFSSMYTGMHSFLSATQERKDLILLQRDAEYDETIQLKGDYQELNELALRVKQAKDLFLIIGPPGTGKTSFGLINTLKEELLTTTSSILLLAYTNRAVDEICSKLDEEGFDFIRIGSKLSCDENYHHFLLEDIVQKSDNTNDIEKSLQKTRIIVGTTASLNLNSVIFNLKHFSLAIIDEASQLLEPYLIGLLSALHNDKPAIRKFVLIGDQKQLPAVVQQNKDISKVIESELKEISLTDCRLSLFERLLKKYKDNKHITYQLTKQGRMHKDIALFPKYVFYNGKLDEIKDTQKEELPYSGHGKNGIEDLILTRRVAFISASKPTDSLSDKVNQIEANIITATVLQIYKLTKARFKSEETIGVIVPYRNQIATIKNTIEKYEIPDLNNITIDTVERFQGSQRDYIIYGFTIQKYSQLEFLTNDSFIDNGVVIDRKLNVAITRAKEHLIMVGNTELLSQNPTFSKLIEFTQNMQGFLEVSSNDYVEGKFNVPDIQKAFNLSNDVYTLSERYKQAYLKFVQEQIRNEQTTVWPNIILGCDMQSNKLRIDYGRINFCNNNEATNNGISPKEQVLIYCYYFMRMHYCSIKSIFCSFNKWIETKIRTYNKRVQFIDIGCGPASCGIAFTESFIDIASTMQYIGIDISIEMKNMGKNLMQYVFEDKIKLQMIESFDELNDTYWNTCSQSPSLIIFNLSYFFSNVSSSFTKHLAQSICTIITNYPHNKYLFIIQHSDIDKGSLSYKAFKNIIYPSIEVIKDERSEFIYQLSQQNSLAFCYEILESK